MRALTAAVLTAAGAAAFVVWSPRLAMGAGPLTQGHADVENRCTACHVPFRGADAMRCLTCHAAGRIPTPARAAGMGAERVATLRGLHAGTLAADCLACHTDHAGHDPASGTKPFAHEQLASEVRARCAACHEGVQPGDAVHRRPTPCGACHGTSAWTPATFTHDAGDLTLARRCAECHAAEIPARDGLHDIAMQACADCHGVARWTPARFEHGRFFQLDRDHDVRCSTCHQDRARYTAYTCYGCHEHTPAGMRREHAEEGVVRDLAGCARCHRSADGEGGEGDRGHDD